MQSNLSFSFSFFFFACIFFRRRHGYSDIIFSLIGIFLFSLIIFSIHQSGCISYCICVRIRININEYIHRHSKYTQNTHTHTHTFTHTYTHSTTTSTNTHINIYTHIFIYKHTQYWTKYCVETYPANMDSLLLDLRTCPFLIRSGHDFHS